MSTLTRVRVCPMCGTDNPPTASDCTSCGADILAEPIENRTVAHKPEIEEPSAESTPRDAVAEQTSHAMTLEVLQDPELRFQIQDGQSVGRSDSADVVLEGVPNLDYISRRMAVFRRRDGQWFVQHVASTNYITVDGDRYESDEEVALNDGTVLGLALSQFLVRLPEVS